MKKLISMALAAGMAVSLAACGGAASSSAPAADSAAASTTEAAADSDLAYIQGKGKMTIGYTVYEPMNYTCLLYTSRPRPQKLLRQAYRPCVWRQPQLRFDAVHQQVGH